MDIQPRTDEEREALGLTENCTHNKQKQHRARLDRDMYDAAQRDANILGWIIAIFMTLAALSSPLLMLLGE